jgi:hypothetical protein
MQHILIGRDFLTKILFNSFKPILYWSPRVQKIGAGFILMLASCLLLVLFQEIGVAKADTSIHIKSYGDIESTDMIEHGSDVYTVTGIFKSQVQDMEPSNFFFLILQRGILVFFLMK